MNLSTCGSSDKSMPTILSLNSWDAVHQELRSYYYPSISRRPARIVHLANSDGKEPRISRMTRIKTKDGKTADPCHP
jgi:hypothetical protein